MRKIKTVFEMIYDKGKPQMGDIRPESMWVFTEPNVKATVKYDGTATAVINGEFYARLDAKNGRNIPVGAIPCEPEPDPITGHWPHWVPVTAEPAFKWHMAAYNNTKYIHDATYEAIGPHFQGNPYKLDKDILIEHGATVITDLPKPLTKESLEAYFHAHPAMEGIVFYGENGKMAKLRLKDYKMQPKY